MNIASKQEISYFRDVSLEAGRVSPYVSMIKSSGVISLSTPFCSSRRFALRSPDLQVKFGAGR